MQYRRVDGHYNFPVILNKLNSAHRSTLFYPLGKKTMSSQFSRDRDRTDIADILAIDWATPAVLGLDSLAQVEYGRKWNAHVLARESPPSKTGRRRETKERPMIHIFDADECCSDKERLDREKIQARISELREWKRTHPNNYGDNKPGEDW